VSCWRDRHPHRFSTGVPFLARRGGVGILRRKGIGILRRKISSLDFLTARPPIVLSSESRSGAADGDDFPKGERGVVARCVVIGFMSLRRQARIAATRLFVLHTGGHHKDHAADRFEPLQLDGALRPSPNWSGSILIETPTADQCYRELTGN